jgi:uncharacterized membrane protein YtjA (UPF0391 family)
MLYWSIAILLVVMIAAMFSFGIIGKVASIAKLLFWLLAFVFCLLWFLIQCIMDNQIGKYLKKRKMVESPGKPRRFALIIGKEMVHARNWQNEQRNTRRDPRRKHTPQWASHDPVAG